MSGKFKTNRIVMTIVAIVIAWGMKYHYSHSSSDELAWILAPTAYLVQMTGDMKFKREINTGYLNNEYGIVIAPSCSGVNFMIIVFCLSAYTGLKHIKTAPAQFLWIMVSMACSYAYTLLVNTFRISLSLYSMRTEFLQTWFSRETVHLLEGVIVYFIFLLIYNHLLNRTINPDGIVDCRKPFMPIRRFLLPLSFYLSFTLVVPVLNHGGLLPDRSFTEFAIIVLAVCSIVCLLFFLFKVCCHYIAVRVK